MEILERKINLIKYFINIDNEKLLTNIEKLIYANENQEDTSFSPMSIEELKNRIEISMKDSENNNLTSQDDLIEEIKTWR